MRTRAVEEDIKKHIDSHFKSIFTASRKERITLKEIWRDEKQEIEIENEFEQEEIKRAIWSLGQDKAFDQMDSQCFLSNNFGKQ